MTSFAEREDDTTRGRHVTVGTRGEVAKWDHTKYCASCNTSKPPVTQGSDPRVFKLDKTGKCISSRELPHPDGTYPTIHSVIVTPKRSCGSPIDRWERSLVLDTNLKPLREIQQPNLASGLFVDAKGHIWMSSGMDGMIMSLDENGKITGWLGKG